MQSPFCSIYVQLHTIHIRTCTHTHTHTHTVYEAMEEYSPVSEDEIGFKVHDKIKVIAKSMDGWWKIRSAIKPDTWYI